jgi:hypothetical protein
MRAERMIVGVVVALLATFAGGAAVASADPDMTYNSGDPKMTYNCVVAPDMTYNCTEMTGN